MFNQRFLLLPMLGSQRRAQGVLEISQISKDNINDLQYFALILNKYCKWLINKITKMQQIHHELKYRDFFYDSFLELIKSKSKAEFSTGVRQMAAKIFQVT